MVAWSALGHSGQTPAPPSRRLAHEVAAPRRRRDGRRSHTAAPWPRRDTSEPHRARTLDPNAVRPSRRRLPRPCWMRPAQQRRAPPWRTSAAEPSCASPRRSPRRRERQACRAPSPRTAAQHRGRPGRAPGGPCKSSNSRVQAPPRSRTPRADPSEATPSAEPSTAATGRVTSRVSAARAIAETTACERVSRGCTSTPTDERGVTHSPAAVSCGPPGRLRDECDGVQTSPRDRSSTSPASVMMHSWPSFLCTSMPLFSVAGLHCGC